jgi:mono/diheme cytochrome c family protein
MNESEPDYLNPSVVRINSIALGLSLCFVLTLVIVWLFGRGAESLVEPIPNDPPRPTAVPVVAATIPYISTPSEREIAEAYQTADVYRGEALFSEYGCANCHSLDGSSADAPSLQGIARRVPPEYDSAEAYLAEMILDPPDSSGEARGGYPNAMPSNYDELLSAQELADLIVFLTGR